VPSPTVNYGFSFAGWLFGGVGQQVQVLSVDGLDSLPSVRNQDSTRGYADGLFTGRDFASGRQITFNLQIMGDNSNNARYYVNQLRANLLMQQYGTSLLQFQIPSRSLQFVNARVRDRGITIDPDYSYGKAYAKVVMLCPDPRIYDNTVQTQTVTTPALGTGRIYNRLYNLTYTGSGGGSSVTCTNSGTYTTVPTFTITGPCTNPVIVNATTGQKLAFTVVLSSVLDTLVVNSDLRTVLYNGSSARNLLTTDSSWFMLPVGSTIVGFVAGASSAGASLTIQFSNAYL
jgi:Phage tail protein